MSDSIKHFFLNNQSSIIVSLIVGLLFFILGPLGLWFSGKKVKREKINKAKSELLDLIESMLVNKEFISISKLLTLFRAIERQNGINLGLDSDLNNILEDLSLRFAKSKHLSSDQKDSYLKQIDDLIEELTTPKIDDEVTNKYPQRALPKSMKSLVSDLREEAVKLNSDSLTEKINELEKQYSTRFHPLFEPFFILPKLMKERPKTFAVAVVIYIVMVVLAMKYI